MTTKIKIPLMSEQEAFDKIVATLFGQGRPSIRRGDCLYRGPDGLKCAAGALISDSEYDPAYEHRGWADLIASGIAPKLHAGMIMAAQFIHDYAFAEELWVDGAFRKFTLMAQLFDLNTVVLNAAYAAAKEAQCSTQ